MTYLFTMHMYNHMHLIKCSVKEQSIPILSKKKTVFWRIEHSCFVYAVCVSNYTRLYVTFVYIWLVQSMHLYHQLAWNYSLQLDELTSFLPAINCERCKMARPRQNLCCYIHTTIIYLNEFGVVFWFMSDFEKIFGEATLHVDDNVPAIDA